MKFVINKEEKKEGEIELFLKEESSRICLIGRDREGNEEYIMLFKSGKFYRYFDIDLEGLETDKDGKIREMEEYE